MNTKTIVTYDMDFAFPKNNSYYDYVDKDKFNKQSLDNVDNYNIDLLRKILSICKNVLIVNTHDEVLNFVDFNEYNNVINFDHHHDIMYSNDTIIDINNWIEFDEYKYELPTQDKESMWAGYLIRKNNINYTWIRNKLSSDFEYSELFKYNEILNTEINVDDIKCDMVVIVRSPKYCSKKQIEFIKNKIMESI